MVRKQVKDNDVGGVSSGGDKPKRKRKRKIAKPAFHLIRDDGGIESYGTKEELDGAVKIHLETHGIRGIIRGHLYRVSDPVYNLEPVALKVAMTTKEPEEAALVP